MVFVRGSINFFYRSLDFLNVKEILIIFESYLDFFTPSDETILYLRTQKTSIVTVYK